MEEVPQNSASSNALPADQSQHIANASANSDTPVDLSTPLLNNQSGELSDQQTESESDVKEDRELNKKLFDRIKKYKLTEEFDIGKVQVDNAIEKFCQLYGKMIKAKATNFSTVTSAWKHFEIRNQEYFWENHGHLVWNKVTIDGIDRNFGKLAKGEKNEDDHCNVKKLFSILMYDWMSPKPDQTYALPTKMDQFDDSSKDLAQVLLEISENPNFSIYRNVVLRIFYQYFHELDQNNDLKDGKVSAYVNAILDHFLKINDNEMKSALMKIGTVFSILCCEDNEKVKACENKIKSHVENEIAKIEGTDHKTMEKGRTYKELEKFCQLCFLLKNEESSFTKFQKTFDMCLWNSKHYYGDYFSIAIIRDVRLLLFMASKKQLFAVRDYIFGKFPDIGVNSSIMTHFEIVRDFATFNIEKFSSKELNNIVSPN